MITKLNLLKIYLEKSKIGYHDHEGLFPEHPVAVKYHFRHLQSKPVLEIKPKKDEREEENLREKHDTGIRAGRRKIDGIKKAIFQSYAKYPKMGGSDYSEAINMLEDYNKLAYGEAIDEVMLNIYLRKGYKALHESFPGEIKFTSDRKTKEAITVQKLIINAKSYTDKIIAFDALMSAQHSSGTYLGEMYPSLDDETIDEKIIEWLDFLAKK